MLYDMLYACFHFRVIDFVLCFIYCLIFRFVCCIGVLYKRVCVVCVLYFCVIFFVIYRIFNMNM